MTNTPETPMRERIARIMDKTAFDPPDGHWKHFETRRKDAFEIADAVLNAMREPTSGMMRKAEFVGEYPWDGKRMERIWRAAIDAAKEGK